MLFDLADLAFVSTLSALTVAVWFVSSPSTFIAAAGGLAYCLTVGKRLSVSDRGLLWAIAIPIVGALALWWIFGWAIAGSLLLGCTVLLFEAVVIIDMAKNLR